VPKIDVIDLIPGSHVAYIAAYVSSLISINELINILSKTFFMSFLGDSVPQPAP